MTTKTLTAALTDYPHTSALMNGTVGVAGYELSFPVDLDPGTDPNSVPDIVQVFRRMAREQPWDLSELGITTAVLAKEHGVPITMLPLFVTRRFDHASFAYNVNSISHPSELTGKRIGMRSPNVPDVLWSLGILEQEFGVDIHSVEWIVTGDEHIPDATPTGRVTFVPGGREKLPELVESGEVAAIMAPYRGTEPHVKPVFPDLPRAERQWYDKYGYVPIHHVMVVRTELLRADDTLASKLYEAFVEAKQPMLDRFERGEDVLATFSNPRHIFGVDTTPEVPEPEDPFPYGIEANRVVLEDLVRHMHHQGAIKRPYELDELFAWD